MVELHIKEDEVAKYLYFIVVFNALFPKILEESNLRIYIVEVHTGRWKCCHSYTSFLQAYDHLGLNEVAI